MPSESSTHEDDSEANLRALVNKLLAEGRTFSITLDDTADVRDQRGGDRTKRFLGAMGSGECRKWVYQPGVGPVCVDPPS